MNESVIQRRQFIKTLGLSAAALSFMPPMKLLGGEGVKRPNILFIAVDDLRPQLNCYGHSQMISPNIDKLASNGTLFERAYCQVAVCGASRASLLSGLRPTPDRFINYNDRADIQVPGITTLPMHLRRNGYYTISNGKVYHFKDDDINAWSEIPFRVNNPHRYLREENKELHAQNQKLTGGEGKNSRGPAFEWADVPDDQYPDHIMTDKAIADLRKLKSMDKPFFLAAGYLRPHLPFNAPKRFWDMYERSKIDLADNPFRPKGAPDAALHTSPELRKYHDIPKTGHIPDETARNLIHGYYACTTFTDYEIGRLLNELKSLNLIDNTIIILWGDHGWQLGEHDMWCKHSNFETSTHAPMIINTPGYKMGIRSNKLVEFVDIYPTLCELTGLPLPDHLQGTSFAPLMRNPDLPWKQVAFSRWKNGWSIKTDRYRYTEWYDDQGEVSERMLYDHTIDPHENENISEYPENSDLVSRLSYMLQKGWKAYQ